MKRIKQKNKNTISVGDVFYLDCLHIRSTVIGLCEDNNLGTKLVITRFWSKHEQKYCYENHTLQSFIYLAMFYSDLSKEWADRVCDNFEISYLI